MAAKLPPLQRVVREFRSFGEFPRLFEAAASRTRVKRQRRAAAPINGRAMINEIHLRDCEPHGRPRASELLRTRECEVSSLQLHSRHIHARGYDEGGGRSPAHVIGTRYRHTCDAFALSSRK